jgi:membrane-bound inhibitor of C-type lysozyme
MTTVAGQKVTVKQASSTTYEKGTSSATASVVTKGATVLVLGMTNSTTITASQVIVQPPASGGSPSYTPSAVVPFTQGSPSRANKDGKIPTDYTEGSGTIVSGTAADKAAEVALTTYPGGVVDRVVKLSNGEYEVHYIGVNWPHHVFVTSDYMVVGAY